jgi:hypothetical protein
MSRGFDGEKLKRWRERFRRYAESTQTVENFCRSEGVSVPAFYQWRKKLALSPRKRQSEKRPAFRPLMVTPSVQVMPDPPAASPRGYPAPGPAAFLVRLPSGATLEVPRENLETVRVVVAELLRAGQGQLFAAANSQPAGGDRC